MEQEQKSGIALEKCGTASEQRDGTASEQKGGGILKTLKTAPVSVPLLTAAVYVLLTLCGRFVNEETVKGSSVFLVIIVMQIVVFAAPCFLYFGIRGGKAGQYMLSGKIGGNALLFSAAAFLVMLSGSLFLQFLFFRGGEGISYDKGYMDALYAQGGGAPLFLSYCLVPAVCEELFFRGVVIGEYRRYGGFNAVLISALYFTMIHFTTSGFVIYLFAGLVLGFTALVCRSVYPSMLLHMLFNIYALYGNASFISKVCFNTSAVFVGFVLLVLLLLALAFMFSRMETVFSLYSERAADSPVPEKSVNHLYVYLTPALLVPILVFIAIDVLM